MSKKNTQSAGFDKNLGLITFLRYLADKKGQEHVGKFLFQLKSIWGNDSKYNTFWWKRLRFITNILADIAIVVAAALFLTLAGPAAPAILLPLAIGALAAGSLSRAVTSFTNNLDNVEFRKYNWPANILILAGAALTVASLFFPPLLPVLLGCAAAAYVCGIGINQFGVNKYTKLQAEKLEAEKLEAEKLKADKSPSNSSSGSTASITDETHLRASQGSRHDSTASITDETQHTASDQGTTASIMSRLGVFEGLITEGDRFSSYEYREIDDEDDTSEVDLTDHYQDDEPDDEPDDENNDEPEDYRSSKVSFGQGSND